MSKHHSRRHFLGLGAASTLGAALPPGLSGTGWLASARFASSAAIDPEIIVINARVYTVDAALPRAEGFAISGGRFVAVGTSSEMRSLAGKRTQVIDAKGLTVVPGFIDTHNHAGGATLLYEVLVGNPFEVEFVSIASIIEKLKARARTTPVGTWVEGWFHDDTKLTDKRAAHTSRSRSGKQRTSRRRSTSRWTYEFLQQQSV